MSSVRGVVDALVKSNRSTTIKTTGANEFAWNILAWACFQKLETYHILTKIDTDDVACVLGTTKITPKVSAMVCHRRRQRRLDMVCISSLEVIRMVDGRYT